MDRVRAAPAVARRPSWRSAARRRRPRSRLPERWDDPHPLDRRTPYRMAAGGPPARCRATRCRAAITRRPPRPGRTRCRCCAPTGEAPAVPVRARTVSAASPAGTPRRFARARRLIYVEDQYLWSSASRRQLADGPARQPELRLVVVVPRYPDEDGRLAGRPTRLGQRQALDLRPRAGGRTGRGLRPREEEGTPDLRARQGLHRRRRLVDVRFRQPQPAVLDQRQRDRVRRRRRATIDGRSRPIRRAGATAPASSRATPGSDCGREHLGEVDEVALDPARVRPVAASADALDGGTPPGAGSATTRAGPPPRARTGLRLGSARWAPRGCTA